MIDLISGVVVSIVVFAFVVFLIYISYHLLFDEDDPVKLKLEAESFDGEWKDLCSKF